MEWPFVAPMIHAINQLKIERKAVILGHNYQAPEIYHGVSDIVGDSLALATKACDANAEVIVLAGVYFMAETAKLMNPEKTVLIPDPEAGCSLSSSITGADVRALRAKYPGIPAVAYVNTSAEVKAEVDICCTSGNALEVVESLNVPRVLFLPDRYLAQYIASQTSVEIIPWEGSCEVHTRFHASDIEEYRERYDHLTVISHPECLEDVQKTSDFVGSSAQMINFIAKHRPPRILMLTECSMSDNITSSFPEIEFVRPCNLCPHMRKITLKNILESLQTMQPKIEIDPAVAERARRSVERMVAVKPSGKKR
jgi:quinolinate synthase